MKTLTVTLHHSTNYGATLQAYALQQALIKMGHENIIFEYPYSNKNTVKSNSKSIKIILRSNYLKVARMLRGNKTEKLGKQFAEFHKARMNLTRIYESMDDLRNDPPLAEAYITGSDQVWNLSKKNKFIPARFLDFGEPSIKRLSYAASIENLNYSEEEKAMVRRCLNGFSGISLREKSACDYIREITGKETVHVVDPVFLLTPEQWAEMACEPRIKGPYILTYQVLRNDRMKEVVTYLRKKTGYPIVQVCNTSVKWIKADKTFFDVSPEEFIGLYMNSSIVVSASFHGTALGLVFGKPTYGLVRSEFGNRIKEVLEMFGVGDYCISQTSAIPEPQIDTENLKQKIENKRKQSLEYLKQTLS